METLPANSNIGLRLPQNVIGIDVDAYDDKPGLRSLKEREEEWGELPPTWMSTARDDGVSGIRLYRIPEGLNWPNVVGPGIEVIRYGHRFMVAWPSWNPKSKSVYHWYRPDGTMSTNGIPHVDDLPDLPEAWVQGLTKGALEKDVPKGDGTGLEAACLTPGSPCAQVAAKLAEASAAFSSQGSRHDEVCRIVLSLLYLGSQGHAGVAEAMSELHAAWIAVMAKERANEAEPEWQRLVDGAYPIIAGDPRPAELCLGPSCSGSKLAPAWDGPPDMPAAVEPSTPDSIDEADLVYETELAYYVRRLRLQEDARRVLAREKAGPVKSLDVALLDDVLRRPPPPPHRVKGLIPWEASTLLVAQRKTGKTTFALNLVRALVSGEPFLGSLDVVKVEGRVAYVNLEVADHTIGRWAADIGIPGDRLVMVNLRDGGNPFADPELMAALAARLRSLDVEVVVVDTFIQAFGGEGNENSAGDVMAFLHRLSQWAREQVGASDLILTTHAGWGGERSRGSSALEDWADSIITLTRPKEEDDGPRFIKAQGRDIAFAEDRLDFRPGDKRLVLTGQGSRQQRAAQNKLAQLAVFIERVVHKQPGMSTQQIVDAIKVIREAGEDNVPGHQRNDINRALAWATQKGVIRCEDEGSGKAKRYYPVQPGPTPS